MTAVSKLRRLRFSLRTLFVAVTVVAITMCWVMWEVSIVRERNRAKAWIVEQGGFISDSSCAPADVQLEKSSHFPEFRRWFGDEPVVYINLVRSGVAWDERNRVANLFPESWVVPERPTGLVAKR